MLNSIDSGTGQNDYGTVWWAVIDYVLHVRVVETELGSYCATVRNEGSFESVGGDSPGCATHSTCGTAEGEIGAGVLGRFRGGYTENFTGTFDPGDMRTAGSIGVFDHMCDPSMADGGCVGAGITRWLGLYFTDVAGFDFDEWWGWIYRAGRNGTWVNSIDGNEGDITGD